MTERVWGALIIACLAFPMAFFGCFGGMETRAMVKEQEQRIRDLETQVKVLESRLNGR